MFIPPTIGNTLRLVSCFFSNRELFMRLFFFMFLFSVFVPMSLASEPDRMVLGNFPFESNPAPDWLDDQGAGPATLDHDRPHSGTGCFQFAPGKKDGVTLHYRYGFNPPVLKEPRARLLRVSLWIRTRDAEAGEVKVIFLKSYDKGRLEWFYPNPLNYTNNIFMTLPASSEWTKVQGQALIDPDVRGMIIYLGFGNRSGKAQFWLDDMTVELLDRGLMFQSSELGNNLPGDRNQVDLIVSGSKKLESGTVGLYDEENRLINTVAIIPNLSVFSVKLPDRGYYLLKAEARYPDGIVVQAQTRAAVVGPDIPEKMRRQSPFGICGVGSGNMQILAGARWDRDFFSLQRDDYKQAADAGFPADRKPVVQKSVLTDRDMVYTLCVQPDWLQNRNGKPMPTNSVYYPPKDWKQFCKFIQYVIRSIEGKVGYVEVANEPDDWQGTWAEFVRYHEEMARAVKSVNPQAKFMGPGFCQIEMSRVRAAVEAGLLNCIDIFSIHAYVKATPPEDEYIENIRGLKAYLASLGHSKMPIMITEYGWTVPPGDWQRPVDPLTQARYVSRSSILLVAEQIDGFIYFLTRAAEGPMTSAAGYSLLNWDFTPRPGFAAFANAARMLTGVNGPGRILKISPSTYLVLFKKGTGTLAVVWDVKGNSTAFIPKPWIVARDMVGRMVKEPAGNTLAISPSPIFIEIADPSFYRMAETQTIQVSRGEKIPFAWKPLWIPSALSALHVSEGVALGQYLIIGKGQEGWRTLKVNVTTNLEIESAQLLWLKTDPSPKLQVTLRSNLDKPMDLFTRVKLGGVEDTIPFPMKLAPKAAGEVTLPLGKLVPGHRYQGHLLAESLKLKAKPPVRDQFPLDLTVVPCFPVEGSDLSKLPDMDFSAWAPFDSNYQTVKPFSEQDCTAQLKTGYSDEGLHLLITVRDNTHLQNQEPKDMWKEDSIQLGFDLDAEKPWVANIGGCNGHFKVVEYGVALGQTGQRVWRWVSFAKELPGDTEEKRIKAQITRRGSETIYDLVFPWAVLGLNVKPISGSKIGFSLAVNDTDPGTERHGLRLFDGIIESKDPARFGTLWVR
jgi:hypothetical protein